jgi:hypothetical protein
MYRAASARFAMPPKRASESGDPAASDADFDSVPFAQIGRVVTLPGYRNVQVAFRDHPRHGETLEECGERVSRMVDTRIRADIRKADRPDFGDATQTSLDDTPGSPA